MILKYHLHGSFDVRQSANSLFSEGRALVWVQTEIESGWLNQSTQMSAISSGRIKSTIMPQSLLELYLWSCSREYLVLPGLPVVEIIHYRDVINPAPGPGCIFKLWVKTSAANCSTGRGVCSGSCPHSSLLSDAFHQIPHYQKAEIPTDT